MAYIILGQDAADSLNIAKEFYETALQTARRVLGEKVFKEDEGFFWLITETRPYMIAKWNLAEVLWNMGERKEAIDHLKEMLKLNKNDNQGIRYILLSWLLQEEDNEYLEKLFKEYEDDTSASFEYGKALFHFKKGNIKEATKLLKEAFKANPHVPKYLLGLKKQPKNPPDYIGFGDEAEAQAYMFDAFDAWRDTEGALEWMKENR